MFYEPELSPSVDQYNATLVVTKTLYLTATTTVSVAIQTTATETLTAAPTEVASFHEPTFHIPHHPKVDTAFTAVFGALWIVLITGVVIRKKSKKLKSFNIPLILGTFFNALGHFLHADYNFISKQYELGRVIRIILTLAPIFYSLALFALHRKTRNRSTVHSAMIFSCLAGLQVLYCFIAAFGDGAVLFYTEQKWGEMDIAKHLAVSQVFGQQFMLCVMLGMWLRGRNVDGSHSLSMEEILALVSIPTILGALMVRVSAQFIMIIRNDQCFMVYEILERSAEIHFASAGALSVAVLTSVLSQAWLWKIEWKASKRREERENESGTWRSSAPCSKM